MEPFDYVLLVPGLIYILAFALMACAKGSSADGYTVFGSKRLGNVLFLVMVSGVVVAPFAFVAFVWGVVRLALRWL